jgi:hypothetical protein
VQGSEGVVYPSVRGPGGEWVGLLESTRNAGPTQGQHLDYHRDGAVVDIVR